MAADVVAVKGDVDGAEAGLETGLLQEDGQAAGERDAAVGDAEKEQAGGTGVPLGQGGSNAPDGLFDRWGVVLRGCGHEPKFLRTGAVLVQRKGGPAGD